MRFAPVRMRHVLLACAFVPARGPPRRRPRRRGCTRWSACHCPRMMMRPAPCCSIPRPCSPCWRPGKIKRLDRKAYRILRREAKTSARAPGAFDCAEPHHGVARLEHSGAGKDLRDQGQGRGRGGLPGVDRRRAVTDMRMQAAAHSRPHGRAASSATRSSRSSGLTT